MKTWASLFAVCLFTFTTASFGASKGPAVLPVGLRVDSSKPLSQVWDNLTDTQKRLGYHLAKAANLGRTFIFYQSHRYSLSVRNMLVNSLEQAHIQDTHRLLGDAGFQEYLTYAAVFLNGGGPYNNANRKYVLSVVTPDNVRDLIRIYIPKSENQMFEITELLTNPSFEVQRSPEDATDDLKDAGGNLYARGITSREMKEAMASGFVSKLNCRVVRKADGLVLHCVFT